MTDASEREFSLRRWRVRRWVFWWPRETPASTQARQHARVLRMARRYGWTVAKEVLVYVGGEHAGCSTIWLEKPLKGSVRGKGGEDSLGEHEEDDSE